MTERNIPETPQEGNPQDPNLDCLGPNWSEMTFREQFLYGFSNGLTQRELDKLWDAHKGDGEEDEDVAA